jgi:hypothetical protein
MKPGDWGRRRSALLCTLGAMAVVWGASSAWACVPFTGLRATPSEVDPGEAITLIGSQFRTQTPVVIRLDSLEGPELARFMVVSDKGPFFRETVVIPADISPGHHILVATQETPAWVASPPWGIPARTVITVRGAAPPAPPPAPPAPRTAELTQDSVGAMSFALVAVSVAAVAVLGFGSVALLVSRRAEKPAPATVRS